MKKSQCFLALNLMFLITGCSNTSMILEIDKNKNFDYIYYGIAVLIVIYLVFSIISRLFFKNSSLDDDNKVYNISNNNYVKGTNSTSISNYQNQVNDELKNNTIYNNQIQNTNIKNTINTNEEFNSMIDNFNNSNISTDVQDNNKTIENSSVDNISINRAINDVNDNQPKIDINELNSINFNNIENDNVNNVNTINNISNQKDNNVNFDVPVIRVNSKSIVVNNNDKNE